MRGEGTGPNGVSLEEERSRASPGGPLNTPTKESWGLQWEPAGVGNLSPGAPCSLVSSDTQGGLPRLGCSFRLQVPDSRVCPCTTHRTQHSPPPGVLLQTYGRRATPLHAFPSGSASPAPPSSGSLQPQWLPSTLCLCPSERGARHWMRASRWAGQCAVRTNRGVFGSPTVTPRSWHEPTCMFPMPAVQVPFFSSQTFLCCFLRLRVEPHVWI